MEFFLGQWKSYFRQGWVSELPKTNKQTDRKKEGKKEKKIERESTKGEREKEG